MNPYYTATGNPLTLSRAASAAVRAEFQAIAAGFDKIPISNTLFGTSATAVVIGMGVQAFATQTGLGWGVGTLLGIYSLANSTNFMLGQVTAYNSTTGALSVNVTVIGGAGNFADWQIGLAATQQSPVPIASGGTGGNTVVTAVDSLRVHGPDSLMNLSLSFGVAGNAMTVNAKTRAGAVPSAADPVQVSQRDSVLATGDYNVRAITAALLLVVPSGATLGHGNATAGTIWWYLLDNAGVEELACSAAFFGFAGIATTTTISGGSTSATAMYSGVGRAAVPFRSIGYTLDTQVTAGLWALVPTTVELLPAYAPGVLNAATLSGRSSAGFGPVESIAVAGGLSINNGVLSSLAKNYAINGSFAVNQIVNSGTTDNSYAIDGWRLLLGAANAATAAQDTADVPTGAGFALKLTVGAGNNNKFGAFCPIENKDIVDLRGGVASIRVPLKATAGLTDGTGQIRIGILQWTGAADAISASPVSAWNAEGTNPTLNANWSFINVPAAIAVGAVWGDQTVVNVPVAAGATNLGILIWSDDKVTAVGVDILRIGGYVTLAAGAGAPAGVVAPFDQELRKAQRYYCKTFPYATAPAQNAGTAGAINYIVQVGTTVASAIPWTFPTPMRIAPTVTFYNPSAANTSWRSITRTADNGASSIPVGQNENFLMVKDAGNGSQALGDVVAIHGAADARL